MLFIIFADDVFLINTAFADSDTEEESKPKVEKGKGKATEPEQSQPKQDISDIEEQSRKQELEKLDYEYAVYLQSLEQENWEEMPYKERSPSRDSYSVYSSDAHSDDSDNTKQKKLEVKEFEETNRLYPANKRKFPFEDENPQS